MVNVKISIVSNHMNVHIVNLIMIVTPLNKLLEIDSMLTITMVIT